MITFEEYYNGSLQENEEFDSEPLNEFELDEGAVTYGGVRYSWGYSRKNQKTSYYASVEGDDEKTPITRAEFVKAKEGYRKSEEYQSKVASRKEIAKQKKISMKNFQDVKQGFDPTDPKTGRKMKQQRMTRDELMASMKSRRGRKPVNA